MKHIIIERLLDQGHITIKIADVIINNKTGKADHISDLKGDGIITNSEALTLLRDSEAPSFPFGVPNIPNQPVMPLTYPYNPFNTPGTGPTPPWHVTCTYCADKNFTDK